MMKDMVLALGLSFIVLLLAGVMNSYSAIAWLMFLTGLLLMAED